MTVTRRLALAGGFGLAFYALDRYAYDQTFSRNLRTLGTGLVIAVDYKLNFNLDNAEAIDQLHRRNAERVAHVCRKNGGLYIKFGQQIASLNHVLPPDFAQVFSHFFDDGTGQNPILKLLAPSNSHDEIVKIFREEFGKDPTELFDNFSKIPIASASIAQVHTANLLRDGRKVAVKVQKPQIAKQMVWDLRMNRLVSFLFEKTFDLPILWTVDYVEGHFKEEIDFLNEARNSQTAMQYIQESADLKDNVYIPLVYSDLSTSRILTMEFIEGEKFGDLQNSSSNFSSKDVMKTVVDLFADQIFRTGFIHADPHQGNMIVRKNPNNPKKAQVVLIDHGLYVRTSPKFRRDYAVFWKSLLVNDTESLKKIASSWGINEVSIFATVTLQKPWKSGKGIMRSHPTKAELFKMQKEAKKRIQSFLANTELIPKELIFVGRNLNIVRSNNKALGSPVNRINIMSQAAVRSLGDDWNLYNGTADRGIIRKLLYPLRSYLNYMSFQSIMAASSVGFYVTSWVSYLKWILFGLRDGGYEALLDNQVREYGKQYGLGGVDNPFDA